MIQHKVLSLKKKKIEEIERELDNLSNYEGWISVHPIGKESILLRRILESPQPQVVTETPNKKGKRNVPFPNAVYQ